MSEKEFKARTRFATILSVAIGLTAAIVFFGIIDGPKPIAVGLGLLFLYANNGLTMLAGAVDRDIKELFRKESA